MTTSSLRELNNEIESLINRNQNNEAIFHCMNILRSYPKCIETYRNLGKALLESKRYSEASEIFSKILTVFPDDFVSHVGLSIIQEDQRDLDSAIWHMEHAFDSQPSNLALQEELRRLLGRRDGVPPSKVRLSRGALVRMYARGELYQQAISEIQASLKEDENRLDLQALLAKMYHLSGSKVEAVEVASKILQQYPYCYDANKILFELQPSTDGKVNDIYRQRLTELDPYFEFVSDKVTLSADVPAEMVSVEKLDYSPSPSDEGSIPDWAKLIGIDWKNGEQKTVDITDSRSLADILSEDSGITSPSAPVNPFLESQIFEPEGEEGLSKGNPPEEPLPDWIAKAGWTRAETLDQAQALQANPPESSDNIEDALPADDLPDWLKALNLDEDSGTSEPHDMPLRSNFEEQSMTTEIPSFQDQISSSNDLKESLSNWSNQVEGDSDTPRTDIPQNDDWTNQLINELPRENSAESPELPDWLKHFEEDNANLSGTGDELSEWLPTSVQGDNAEISSNLVPDESKDFELQSTGESSEVTDNLPELEENIDLQTGVSNEIPPLPEETSFTPPPLPETQQIGTESSEKVIPPAPVGRTGKLPGWIRNILSIGAPAAPVAASIDPEQKDHTSEEITEPLVTDLPVGQENEGAISSETKDELLSWLREVNPENEVSIASDLKPKGKSEEVIEAAESSEISFESLITEESGQEDATASLSENEIEQPAVENEVGAFDDRLSGLFEGSLEKPELNEFDDRFSDLLSEPEIETSLVSGDESLPESALEEKDSSDYDDRLSDLLEVPKDETVSTPEIEGFVEEGMVTPELTETLPESLSSEVAEEVTSESSSFSETTEPQESEFGEQVPSLADIEPPQASEPEFTTETREADITEMETPEPIMETSVNLLDLLKNDDYSTLTNEIDQSLDSGAPIESIIDSFKEVSEEKQDKFEFWQLVGDLYTKSSKFDEALEHYSKAEKILLK